MLIIQKEAMKQNLRAVTSKLVTYISAGISVQKQIDWYCQLGNIHTRILHDMSLLPGS